MPDARSSRAKEKRVAEPSLPVGSLREILPRMDDCPFCERFRAGDHVSSPDGTAIAFADRYPIADGHLLIVPRRHLSRLEDLEPSEWLDLFTLVKDVARGLASQPDVDGVNVGFNSGAAAGQTVEHAHVHAIPRRVGDVPDPRGGVRQVIPDRADYWSRRA